MFYGMFANPNESSTYLCTIYDYISHIISYFSDEMGQEIRKKKNWQHWFSVVRTVIEIETV